MPELVTVLKGTAPCSLIQQRPETGTVIHLHQMNQFMLHDVILQVGRQEHQVQTQADIALAAATSPSGMTVMDAYLPVTQASGKSQGLQPRGKDCLGLLTEVLNLLRRNPLPGSLTL